LVPTQGEESVRKDILGWRHQGKMLIEHIRLRTSPVAVKLLKEGGGFPKDVLRPKKSFGFSIALCQAMGMARRFGQTIGVTPEDSACPPSNLFFGWAELDDEKELAKTWLDMANFIDIDAAIKNMESRPRFPKGEYRGLVFSPLNSTMVIPDIILVYCDSAQAMVLMEASHYVDGVGITPFRPLQASGVCSESIISAKLSGSFQLAIPCGGDRRLEGTGDDELIFAFPAKKLDDLLAGIEGKRKKGSRTYPPPRNLRFSPELNKYYEDLSKKMRLVPQF
jgi:uncharacterized protein (DUF169 family)